MIVNKDYDQKGWFLKTFFFMFLLLVTTGAFNYTIDSAMIFRPSFELRKAADALINGNMIAGLKDYDERQLQKLIIEKSKTKYNVIALGSSRILQIRQRFLESDAGPIKFFNHGMSGASIEDYIAILGLYESKGYLPQRMIIGVDPWVFNKNNGQVRWESLERYYGKIMGGTYASKNDINSTNKRKYFQLINRDYTKTNIKTLISQGQRFNIYTTNTTEIDDYIKEQDGSIHYPFRLRFRNDIDTQKDAKLYANSPVYSLEKFENLSNTKLFEDFINYLQTKNIEVMFLLPPYHPLTYNLLTKNHKYKIIMDVETYLRNVAAAHRIKISGSYCPAQYQFSSIDFFDGMHGKDIVMEKLCKQFKNNIS